MTPKNLFLDIKKKYENDLRKCVYRGDKYHLEGDTWTHVCMTYAIARKMSHNFYEYFALLHDLGKIKSFQELEDGKIIYSGHEGISTIMTLDYFDGLDLDDDLEILLLYTINYHGVLWQKSEKQLQKYFQYDKELFSLIEYCSKFIDIAGNISFEKPKSFDLSFNESSRSIFEKDRPTCYILCGLPRSGKSTYRKNNFQNLEIISRDEILLQYGKEKFNKEDYREIWNSLTQDDHKEIDRRLQKKFQGAIKKGNDFVIDMTNLSWKSRRKWYNPKFNYKIIFFLESFSELEKRNTKEGKVPQELFYEMAKRIELPLYGEFDNIIEIELIINGKSYKLNNYK